MGVSRTARLDRQCHERSKRDDGRDSLSTHLVRMKMVTRLASPRSAMPPQMAMTAALASARAKELAAASVLHDASRGSEGRTLGRVFVRVDLGLGDLARRHVGMAVAAAGEKSFCELVDERRGAFVQGRHDGRGPGAEASAVKSKVRGGEEVE